MRKFDLDIEKVLEDWDVSDSLREIIAGQLTRNFYPPTNNVRIYKDSEGWHIRDFGRGLQYKHLTQNENQEKLRRRDLVIRKVGVGPKHWTGMESKSQLFSGTARFRWESLRSKDFMTLVTLRALYWSNCSVWSVGRPDL